MRTPKQGGCGARPVATPTRTRPLHTRSVHRVVLGILAGAAFAQNATLAHETQASALAPAISQHEAAPNTPRVIDDALVRAFDGYRMVCRPSQDAILGFSVATTVKEIPTKGGQEVKKGTLLLRGDDTEDVALLSIQKMRAETTLPVDGAKAEWDFAKVEYERLKSVQSQGASGPNEVERARLAAEIKRISYLITQHNQDQEKIQVARMTARVEKYRLVAPFDGIIDLINADLGQAMGENEKVVRMVNVDPLWIDVPAATDKQETIGLTSGDKAWVLCDIAGRARVAEAKVIEVAPTSDPASRTRRVRVEMANPAGVSRLLAGEPVYVRFSKPENVLVTGLLDDMTNDTTHAAAVAVREAPAQLAPAGEMHK